MGQKIPAFDVVKRSTLTAAALTVGIPELPRKEKHVPPRAFASVLEPRPVLSVQCSASPETPTQ